MTSYIDAHRDAFGVEPICQALAVAPSTSYAARSRPPSARSVRDEGLKADIARVHTANLEVYGVRKTWRQLCREGVDVGRDRVARLMDDLGLHGATRSKRVRTTFPAAVADRPADLVERDFSAPAPDRLWVADLTYVWTRAGFCYTSFIVDAFSRRIVGWRVSSSLGTGVALDALEMALFGRGERTLPGLVHHTTTTGASSTSASATPIGSPRPGSSTPWDHGATPSITPWPRRSTGPYKGELINRQGPGRSVEQVELETAAWVPWWNMQRLHSACGHVPPAEFEAAYHQRLQATTEAA